MNKIETSIREADSFKEFLSDCYLELKEELERQNLKSEYEEVKSYAQDIWDEHQTNAGK
jgi:hypothetical protein